MRKEFYLIILFTLILISSPIFAQTPTNCEPDWEKMPINKAKVDSLVNYAWKYFEAKGCERNYTKFKALAIRAEVLANKVDYPLGAAAAMNCLGFNYQHLEPNLPEAEKMFLEAYEIRKKQGEIGGAVSILNNIINLYQKQEKTEEAILEGQKGIFFLESLDSKDKKNQEVKGQFYNTLGALHQNLTSIPKAVEYLEESLRIRQDLGDKTAIIKTLLNLGALYQDRSIGNYTKADTLLKQCLKLSIETENKDYQVNALISLGAVQFHQANFSVASAYYEKAKLVEDLSIEQKALINIGVGSIRKEEGKLDDALVLWSQVEQDTAQISPQLKMNWYTDMAEIYLQKEDDKRAEIYLSKGLYLAKQLEDLRIEKILLQHMAELYQRRGNFKKAYNILDKQIRIIQDSLVYLGKEAMNQKTNLEETRRKTAELENEKTTLKNRTMTQLLVISVLGILGIISLFLITQQKKKLALQNVEQQKVRTELALKEVDNLITKQALFISNAKLEGRDEERNRVAQDLHDRLGGSLATIKLYFASIEPKLKDLQDESKIQYSKALALLTESCEDVRHIAHNMMSKSLKDYGLKYIVEDLVEGLHRSGKVEVNFDTYGMEERLDEQIETEVYHILQELVSNTLKHANAQKINIQLNHFDDILNIMFEDNGKGFDPNSMRSKNNGMGLRGIRNRVAGLNATMQLDATPGLGTTYSIDIPITA